MIAKSNCVPLLSKEQISTEVIRLGSELNRDYKEKHPIVIGILKGSFIFMADLIRQLEFPIEIDFVRLSSYGSGTETSGKIRIISGPQVDIKGRDIIVIEDIIDSGLSINYFLKYLEKRKPASVKVCALVDKPARRRESVNIDYLGFIVPDEFLVGYGMDCDERYRNLPDVCVLVEE